MSIDLTTILGENIFGLIIAYIILGSGIKYIDAAFDNKVFNKTSAIIIAPLLGIFWGIIMYSSQTSATILLAVVLGVFFKGKIDNRAHLIGFFTVLTIVIIFKIQPYIFPLVFLTAAAVVDEVGNDVTDGNKKNFYSHHFYQQFSLYFFGRRYLMKAAILYLVLMGLFSLEYFLAFLLFDEAYIITSIYSNSRRELKENNDKGKAITT